MYPEFFEKQVRAWCGLHAIHNATGHRWLRHEDLKEACDLYIAAQAADGIDNRREDHIGPNGWYSFHVLATAWTSAAMKHLGRVVYVMQEQPLGLNPWRIFECCGALVNTDNVHWVAMKSVNSRVWLLDSLKAPQALTEAQYVAYLERRPSAFVIQRAPAAA